MYISICNQIQCCYFDFEQTIQLDQLGIRKIKVLFYLQLFLLQCSRNRFEFLTYVLFSKELLTRQGLLAINLLSFCFSEKVSPSLLEDNFSVYIVLCWWVLFSQYFVYFIPLSSCLAWFLRSWVWFFCLLLCKYDIFSLWFLSLFSLFFDFQ